MKSIVIPFTTNGSGAVTAKAEHSVFGKLYAVEYQPGTIATGATITLTGNGPYGSSKPLLTKANAGTANVWFYPRDLVHGVEDGAALTGTSGGDRVCPLLNGVPQIAVASGGATLTGKVILWYED
jgi:hypothetical protein